MNDILRNSFKNESFRLLSRLIANVFTPEEINELIPSSLDGYQLNIQEDTISYGIPDGYTLLSLGNSDPTSTPDMLKLWLLTYLLQQQILSEEVSTAMFEKDPKILSILSISNATLLLLDDDDIEKVLKHIKGFNEQQICTQCGKCEENPSDEENPSHVREANA